MKKQSAALLSIFSNSALIVMKLIAGIMMGSVSVMSEAIHSGIDLMASFIAFIAIKKAGKEMDDDHNYGHAKYENISGFVEALLILLAGVLIIIEAVKKLISSSHVESLGIGILVMLLGSVINFVISRILYFIAKKEKSIALEADAAHLLTDVYTSAGVMTGLIVIKFTGLAILDPVFAVLVALLIVKTSISLIRKSVEDLVDKSLTEDELIQIRDVLLKHPEVINYHKLRTRKYGNCREIDIHIKMNKEMRLEDVHNICHKIETDMKEVFPECHILLHPEPYRDIS